MSRSKAMGQLHTVLLVIKQVVNFFTSFEYFNILQSINLNGLKFFLTHFHNSIENNMVEIEIILNSQYSDYFFFVFDLEKEIFELIVEILVLPSKEILSKLKSCS